MHTQRHSNALPLAKSREWRFDREYKPKCTLVCEQARLVRLPDLSVRSWRGEASGAFDAKEATQDLEGGHRVSIVNGVADRSRRAVDLEVVPALERLVAKEVDLCATQCGARGIRCDGETMCKQWPERANLRACLCGGAGGWLAARSWADENISGGRGAPSKSASGK